MMDQSGRRGSGIVPLTVEEVASVDETDARQTRSLHPAEHPILLILEASLVPRRIPQGVEHGHEQRLAVGILQVGDLDGRKVQPVPIDRGRVAVDAVPDVDVHPLHTHHGE